MKNQIIVFNTHSMKIRIKSTKKMIKKQIKNRIRTNNLKLINGCFTFDHIYLNDLFIYYFIFIYFLNIFNLLKKNENVIIKFYSSIIINTLRKTCGAGYNQHDSYLSR